MEYHNVNNIGYSGLEGAAQAVELSEMSKFTKPDSFRYVKTISITTTVPGVIKALEEVVGRKINETVLVGRHFILRFENFSIVNFYSTKPFVERERTLSLVLLGDVDEVKRVGDELEVLYPKVNKGSVRWYYSNERGDVNKTTVDLNHKNQAHDVFFPWIKPTVAEFQENYLADDANILLLMGEPGCGKSTFVRDLISRNDLSAAVTYDEKLMTLDSFFIEFMNSSIDLLVIEDADLFLTSRESGNKVMNKLLNASDGLIQINKKIVFTANLTTLDDVDPALVRPGRCFDVLMFRELSLREAKAVAVEMNLPIPDGPKTLGELFKNGPTTKATPNLGFHFPKG